MGRPMRTKPYSASGRDRGWSWGMLASVWIACAGRFIGGMPAGILSLRNTSGGTRRGTLSLLCCGHGGWLRLPCEGWCRTLCGCTVSLLPCAGGGLATADPVEVHSPFSFSLLLAGSGWLRLPCEGLRKSSLIKDFTQLRKDTMAVLWSTLLRNWRIGRSSSWTRWLCFGVRLSEISGSGDRPRGHDDSAL